MSASLRAGNSSDGYLQIDGADVLAFGAQSPKFQDFRLTLTTGVPVTTTDVTSATTIYCTPYKGNSISLYDGTVWVTRQSSEFSLALSGLTSGKPYDVFCYDNSGTPTLEFLVWTNDTTRATALTYQDGVLVKSGAATRRYLGTFYTTSTTTTEDSAAKRYLWNYYHRVVRRMQRQETTASWTYTTPTIRQARANTANQLNFLIGVAEDAVPARLLAMVSNSSVGAAVAVGIGLDSTTAFSADGQALFANNTTANYLVQLNANYNGVPSAGRHYLTWLEISSAVGTTTWYDAPGNGHSGISGEVMA